MAEVPVTTQRTGKLESILDSPPINPDFKSALNDLVDVASQGHDPGCDLFNPSDEWLVGHMRIFQDLSTDEQAGILRDYRQTLQEAKEANAQGKAAPRCGPDVVFRLDNGGLASFSQLGVARRPDLTQYFIDGFSRNRDALAFSESNQALFAEVFPYITEAMKKSFASGETIVQTDRQICDAPERSYHARQLLFGVRYLQIPYMWRQLTFELDDAESTGAPDILEVSIPRWLEDLGLPEDLKARIEKAGLTRLVFKAPTSGLSLHLGFDYAGEHKMGPLTIAMFKVKQNNGLAIQAALSMARAKGLNGNMTNTAIVTAGPSLHGKSTLTIMLELANSDLAQLLGLPENPEEGVYPMNDDIVLLQPVVEPVEVVKGSKSIIITHHIDGTENNFYAVPFGLTREDDPITYDVVRGTEGAPNAQETLENVVVDPENGKPDYLQNPTRNMRMILSRTRLLERKGVQNLLEKITSGRTREAAHVPLEDTDRIFWQAVMRQNTVVPPLRKLGLEQYIRVLMYGEAVQMGAAAGAIGKPYVEYFSDPFIIGLEDENANLMHYILKQIERGGIPQEFYVFNTGGMGSETNEEARGPRYKKIPRELTLMLQEALLRGAVRFEYDSLIGSEFAVAITNDRGEEILDLRKDWLPREVYGEAEYKARVLDLRRDRFYGKSAEDKAGILRYTRVIKPILELEDVPPPTNERELSWMLSFYWNVDQAYSTLSELKEHLYEGIAPSPHYLRVLQKKYEAGIREGLELTPASRAILGELGIGKPA